MIIFPRNNMINKTIKERSNKNNNNYYPLIFTIIYINE